MSFGADFVHTAFALGPAILFCPGDRPERFAKAADRADAVIIDLEDAVAPAARDEARAALIAHPLDPAQTVVRVNSAGTADFSLDLAALRQTAYRTVMLAKAESSAEAAQLGDYDVIGLCETAAGVLAAPEIAGAQNVVGLMWGAEDLIASLGGTSSRFADGSYRAVARQSRSLVLLAAGASGKAAIDSVFLAIPDLAGLAVEAEDAVASGFSATACIHPSQVSVIRHAYRPTPEAIQYARNVLEASMSQHGVFQFQGRMIDGPVLRHAETVLRRGSSGVEPFAV